MYPEVTFTIFDTETTGFYPKDGDRIIEIAAIKMKNGEIIEGATFESLVNPEREVPYESAKITGLTTDSLKNAPLIAEVLPQFMDFCRDTVLVAHNAIFDMGFLEEELFAVNPFERVPDEVVCTKQLSKVVFPQEKYHNLDIVAHRFGIEKLDDGRHRALPDVLHLAKVFKRLYEEGNFGDLADFMEKGRMK